MNKIKRAFTVPLLAVALMLVLSACGAKVNTTLTLNKDFSGSRIMTLTLAASDIRDYVTGGHDALKQTLENHLPSALTSSVSQNAAGDAEVVLTLTFDSKDDYVGKVTSLLALDTERAITPEVIIEVQDSMFRQGYTIQENYSSIDLLGWLALGVMEDELTSQGRDNFFEHASTNVVFQGETVKASQSISISSMVSNAMSSIDVTTVPTGGESAKREILFRMNKDKAAQVDGLEDFMKGLLPDGGEFWRIEGEDTYDTMQGVTANTNGGNDILWIFTFSAANAGEMVARTNKILQADNTVYTFSATPNPEIPGLAVVAITQLNDGSFFCNYNTSSWSYTAPLRNILVLSQSYQLTNGYDGYQSKIDSQNGGYTVTSYTNTPMEYTQIYDWVISFDRIEVDTALSPFGGISRTVRYVINKSGGDMTGDALEKLVTENLGKLTYKNASDDANYIYEVSGSASGADAFCSLFGEYLYGEGNAVSKTITRYQFAQGKLNSGNLFSTGYYIEDSFDLSDRLGVVGSESGIVYTVSYPFMQTASKEALTNNEDDSDTAKLKGNQSQTLFTGVSVRVEGYSTGASLLGIFGIILLAAFVILTAVLALQHKAAVIAFIAAQKQARASRPQPVPDTAPVLEDSRTLVGVGASSPAQQPSNENQGYNGEDDLL